MSVKMKFGSKDIPFVYKDDKLIYPNPIKDGLLLWYDFKGMRNTDTNKEVAKDLSGNGNDGTLTNFNFTEGSGYKDNTLVFDGVDDSLTIPELELDETAMSVMHDGKIYSYEDDKVVTVGEDGEITNIPKNILIGSDLSNVRPRSTITSLSTYSKGDEIIVRSEKIESDGTTTVFGFENRPSETSFIEGEDITLSFEARGNVGLNYVFLMRPSASGGNINLYFNTSEMNEQEFKRFSVTTKAPFTTDSGNILVATTQGLGGEAWFEVKNPKLEKGVNATKWMRNPKDYKTTTLSPTSLTDLQLYNKTLRKEELLHNTESKGLKKLKPGVVVQDGLVLHYDFSHESNTSEYKEKAFDYSGNGNHGVLNNFGYAEGSGYEGKGLKFDGVDDFIASPNNISSHILNGSTVEVIVRVEYGAEQYPRIFATSTSGVGRGGIAFYIDKYQPTYFNLTAAVDGDGNRRRGTFNYGKTYHFVHVYTDNLESILYSNGEIVDKIQFTTPMLESNNAVFGADMGFIAQRYYSDAMLSAKIYNRALTPEEIAHNYQIEKEKFNIE